MKPKNSPQKKEKKNKMSALNGNVKLCMLGSMSSPESLLHIGDDLFKITVEVLMEDEMGFDKDLIHMNEWFFQYKRHVRATAGKTAATIAGDVKNCSLVIPYEFTNSKVDSSAKAINRIMYRIFDAWDTYSVESRRNMILEWTKMCNTTKAYEICKLTDVDIETINKLIEFDCKELILFIFTIRGSSVYKTIERTAAAEAAGTATAGSNSEGDDRTLLNLLHLKTYQKYKKHYFGGDKYQFLLPIWQKTPSRMLELTYQIIFIINAFFVGLEYIDDPFYDLEFIDNQKVNSLKMMMAIPDQNHDKLKDIRKKLRGEEEDNDNVQLLADRRLYFKKASDNRMSQTQKLMNELSSQNVYAYKRSFSTLVYKHSEIDFVGLQCEHYGMKRLMLNIINFRKHRESNTLVKPSEVKEFFCGVDINSKVEDNDLYALNIFDPFLNMTNIIETTNTKSSVQKMYNAFDLITSNGKLFTDAFILMVEKHYPKLKKIYSLQKNNNESAESFYIRWILFEFWFTRRFITIPLIDINRTRKGTTGVRFDPSEKEHVCILELIPDKREHTFLEFQNDLEKIELAVKASILDKLSQELPPVVVAKKAPKKKTVNKKKTLDKIIKNDDDDHNEMTNPPQVEIVQKTNRFTALVEEQQSPPKQPKTFSKIISRPLLSLAVVKPEIAKPIISTESLSTVQFTNPFSFGLIGFNLLV